MSCYVGLCSIGAAVGQHAVPRPSAIAGSRGTVREIRSRSFNSLRPSPPLSDSPFQARSSLSQRPATRRSRHACRTSASDRDAIQRTESTPENKATSSAPAPSPWEEVPPLPHPELPYSILTFLASVGAAETAYLTYEKLYGGPLTCPFGGSCIDVLDSAYGTLLGVPLPVYGFISYSTVALLTQISRTYARRRALDDNVRWMQLLLTSVMAGVSGFLLYVMHFELESSCEYCLASAGLTLGLLLLTLKGFTGDELKWAVLPQVGVVAATIVGLSVAFGDARSATAGVQEIDLPPLEPEVTSVSTPLGVKLAKHLNAAGARMYGAFWCSHCYDQKLQFGAEAAKYLPYVECYPDGYRRGVKIAAACEEAKIEGFPTWVINGELIPGEVELNELARLTKFDPK